MTLSSRSSLLTSHALFAFTASDSAVPAGRETTAGSLVAEWVRVMAYLGEVEARAEQ